MNKTIKLNYADILGISDRDLAYIQQDDRLKPFEVAPPSLEAILDVAKSRSTLPIDRPLLQTIIEEQLAPFQDFQRVKDNVVSLAKSDTYTVITAHQPSLFGGQMYTILKAASTVHLAQKLTEKAIGKTIVPVYIVGAEDHDFEEINHLYLFNKRFEWKQSKGGKVGDLMTDSLQEVLNEVCETLGDRGFGPELKELLLHIYRPGRRYGTAHQELLHELFGRFGLVVVQMDDPRLKSIFEPVMERDIFNQVGEQEVLSTISKMEAVGIRPAQAVPRPINIFYTGDGFRARIEQLANTNQYTVVGEEIQFSAESLRHELHQHPERFSPNVILRPVYQEMIFPNLAYIGGGGEIAYWLERLALHETLKVSYPILVRRNSVYTLAGNVNKRLNKLGLDIDTMFRPLQDQIKTYLTQVSDQELDINDEKKQVVAAFHELALKAASYDKSMAPKIEAEGAKVLKQMDNLYQRVIKTMKIKEETNLAQLTKVYENIYPDGKLQERRDNFMNIYVNHGPAWIDSLVESLDPMDNRFLVMLLP